MPVNASELIWLIDSLPGRSDCSLYSEYASHSLYVPSSGRFRLAFQGTSFVPHMPNLLGVLVINVQSIMLTNLVVFTATTTAASLSFDWAVKSCLLFPMYTAFRIRNFACACEATTERKWSRVLACGISLTGRFGVPFFFPLCISQVSLTFPRQSYRP